VLALLRPRAKRVVEFTDQIRPFLLAPASYDPDAVKKHLSAPEVDWHIAALAKAYAQAPFDEATLEHELRSVAEASGIKAGVLIHATRIAMTGRMVSPGLFEMLVLLGRDTVLARLTALQTALRVMHHTR
jgi:glutamyl/glutaminyl-tRNA synthetase